MKSTAEIVEICSKNGIRTHVDDENIIWFCCHDISKFANMGNIHSSIQLLKKMKIKYGSGQHLSHINLNEFKKLFSNSRCSKLTKLGIYFGLEIGDFKCLSFEESTITHIQTVFRSEDTKTQYTVKQYKIDLYFPKQKLAVECDENYHNIKQEADKQRQDTIVNELGCHFIRYKPQDENFSIFNLLAEIRDFIDKNRDEDIATLKQEVIELKSNLEETANNKTELIIDNSTIKKRKFTNGKKVQIYSQDGKTLIKTYDTSLNAQVDPKLDSPTAGCITKAIEEKTIYKGYRWALLDREEDDGTVQEIGETVASKKINVGYVAMLNLDKNKIENVFPDSKDAAKDRKFRSGAPISKAIRQGTQSGGHYFKMWFDCDDEMKEAYLKNNTLPIKSVPSNGITIEKLHPVNKQVVETFASINDIQKSLRCGRKLIKDAIDLEHVCKGYYWQIKT